MPPSNAHQTARFGGPLAVPSGPLRRRAMPAAVGGSARWLARLRAPLGCVPETVHAGAGSRLIFKLLGGALSVLFALVAVPSAQAEEVFTGQAAAANATDSTWIAAPVQRVAVCIVDSGNDPNPDTANVVARFAVDGGSGGDVSDQKHGTLMSMIAAAPFDGFGMVGAAASINVVSVRAMSPNSYDTFGLADIVNGMQTCQNYASTYNIKVISLSVGGPHSAPGGDTTAEALIRDTVDRARAHGLDVVAAAGNRGTSSVDWPAAYTPVVAVGAADNSGARCSFASYGPEVDLWTS
ncbi:MAG: thermitase, partial [Baekduia sp.]|nr:thermitase [Baekduia sp.]